MLPPRKTWREKAPRGAASTLEKGASPIIGERNVYEDNKRNAIAFDEKLEKATIPSMPKR